MKIYKFILLGLLTIPLSGCFLASLFTSAATPSTPGVEVSAQVGAENNMTKRNALLSSDMDNSNNIKTDDNYGNISSGDINEFKSAGNVKSQSARDATSTESGNIAINNNTLEIEFLIFVGILIFGLCLILVFATVFVGYFYGKKIPREQEDILYNQAREDKKQYLKIIDKLLTKGD